MPVSRLSPSVTSTIAVSMRTCESLTSIDSIIDSTVGTSSFWVITTRPFMRLSARTVVLSFVSSPAFGSPVRLLAGAFACVVVRCGCAPRVRLLLCPDLDAAFWFSLDDDFCALPMRSLIMSETSSASAYLRR